jgi:arsenite methyltransferase
MTTAFATPVPTVDVTDLTRQVREMYTRVAREPESSFHFATGRGLAHRLGYDRALLEAIPAEAVDSFAGVGNPIRLADLRPGERVLDLGSGSGTDLFAAAVRVGPTGRVVGRDFTQAQLAKAEHLRSRDGFSNVELSDGPIEALPFADETFDAVISNGVINLSPRKADVFAEAARVVRRGGRLVVSDIVATDHLPDTVVGNADLWAACIGGAAQVDDYRTLITEAGFDILLLRRNDYAFLSDRAAGATMTWGVKSVTLIASRR